MNTQVIAAVAGGLVIGAAAFIPVSASGVAEQAAPNVAGQEQSKVGEDQQGAADGAEVNDPNAVDPAGVPGAPVNGPSFSKEDSDDDEDEEDREDDEDDEDDEDEEDDD